MVKAFLAERPSYKQWNRLNGDGSYNPTVSSVGIALLLTGCSSAELLSRARFLVRLHYKFTIFMIDLLFL